MSTILTYTNFTAAGQLPQDIEDCINNPSTACDTLIGSTSVGDSTTFCGNPATANSVVCACVNNTLPCPMFTSSYCANGFAYKPTTMQNGGADYKSCSGTTVCVQNVDTQGNNNIVTDINVLCDSSVWAQMKTAIQNHPYIAILFVISLVVIFLLLLLKGSNKTIYGGTTKSCAMNW